MAEKKKFKFVVDGYLEIGVRKIVYAETADEALTKALRKIINEKKEKSISGNILNAELYSYSRNESDATQFYARLRPLGGLKNLNMTLHKSGELIRADNGSLENEVAILESLYVNDESK